MKAPSSNARAGLAIVLLAAMFTAAEIPRRAAGGGGMKAPSSNAHAGLAIVLLAAMLTAAESHAGPRGAVA